MIDDSPNIYAAVCITLALATVALSLRLLARRFTVANYGIDDFLAVIAYIGALGYSIVILIWTADYGLGRHIDQGPSDQSIEERLRASRILLFCSSVTYSTSLLFSKLTILAFYWRIFKFTGIRIPIQILFVVVGIWFVSRFCMVMLACIPVQARWDKTIPGGRCDINQSTFFFATIMTHVFIDIAILVLPAVEVGKLHLPRAQKLGVMALFMFGIMVCIASVFILKESLEFKADDLTLTMGIHSAWATVETNLAVVSASLPMLRPILRKFLPTAFNSSHSSGQESSPIYLTHSHGFKPDKQRKRSSHSHMFGFHNQSEDPEPAFPERVHSQESRNGLQHGVAEHIERTQ